MILTNNELIILSLLAEQPSSGYALEDTIQQRGIREWTDLGFSSIYYILQKLEGADLARSQVLPGVGHLAKKEYQLTQVGWIEMQAGVLQRLSNPRPYSPDFAIGLAFSFCLSATSYRQAVSQHQSHLEDQINNLLLKYQTEREAGIPPQAAAVFEYGLHQMRAERTWLKEYLKQQHTEGIKE